MIDIVVHTLSAEGLKPTKNKVTLPDLMKQRGYHEHLVHRSITHYQTRESLTKAQLSRGQVRGSGKKPYRQKGTGRARAGHNRSPIRVGGGVTFAAQHTVYTSPAKLNRKEYRHALGSILYRQLEIGAVTVVESFNIESHKTKDAIKLLSHCAQRACVLTYEEQEKLSQSVSNLPYYSTMTASQVNPVVLYASKHLVIEEKALYQLFARAGYDT